MMFVLKTVGTLALLVLAVLAVAVWDMAANDGRIAAWITGRDTLIASCTPPLRADLAGRGFSPVDIAVGDDGSVDFSAGSFGRRRSLSGSFTFSDGQDGPRIDGHLLCTVQGPAVQVEVTVDALPHRVT